MSEQEIDPRLEAESTLDSVEFSHGSSAVEYAAYAQAYATLELAKQQARTADEQRIANLIALAKVALLHGNPDLAEKLEAQIAERLGLS